MNGASTFKLQDLTVPGSREWMNDPDDDPDYWWWECDPMVAESEYIRVFGTTVLKEDATYTYVSETYIINTLGFDEDEHPDISEHAWAIGWWEWKPNTRYSNLIASKNDALKVKANITFPNGTAFIGNFLTGHNLKIVSQGAVAIETFAFESDCLKCPTFGNQLPVSINLSDLSVPGTREWMNDPDDDPDYWWWECDPMVAESEYIRFFGENVLKEDATYTYVSETYIINALGFDEDEHPDISEHAWAIGWWEWKPNTRYSNLIASKNDALKVKNAISINPGHGFIGNFLTGHNLKVYFPSATSVPSKQ